MPIDPTMYKDLAVIGYDYFKKGAKNFKDFADAMKKEFGDDIKPHLLKIWVQVKDIAKQQEQQEAEELKIKNLIQHTDKDSKIEQNSNESSELEKLDNKSNLNLKDKIIETVYFVGGTFIFIISLTGGYYSRGSSSIIGGYSSCSGFSFWSIIGMAIGICMIVFGFLRRNWNKK